MEHVTPELSSKDQGYLFSEDFEPVCNLNLSIRLEKSMPTDGQSPAPPPPPLILPVARFHNQSVESLVSRKSSSASQVSWGGDDEFDQVLEAISQDIEQHLALLKISPFSRLARFGSSKNSAQRELKRRTKKELRRLQDTLRENLGMSDVRRLQGEGEVQSLYRSSRGTCYRRLLQVRDEVQELLQSLKPTTVSSKLEPAQVEQMSQELHELRDHVVAIRKRLQ